MICANCGERHIALSTFCAKCRAAGEGSLSFKPSHFSRDSNLRPIAPDRTATANVVFKFMVLNYGDDDARGRR